MSKRKYWSESEPSSDGLYPPVPPIPPPPTVFSVGETDEYHEEKDREASFAKHQEDELAIALEDKVRIQGELAAEKARGDVMHDALCEMVNACGTTGLPWARRVSAIGTKALKETAR